MLPPPMVLMHDASARQWLAFEAPETVLQAERLDEVLPVLRQAEEAVARDGLIAAGFISYEAAPAFDEALGVRASDPSLPLVWFGLFAASQELIALPAPPAPSIGGPVWAPSVTEAEYRGAIARVKEEIARGATYQVNYTLRLRRPFPDAPWPLFLQIAAAQQANYSAYVDTGRFVVASSSPELFFSLDGEAILSRPMKGTAPRGRTCTEDEEIADWLHHSEKNRAENIMIVDMIRNDLGRVAATGSVDAPQLFTVERYPTVWQMTSTVTAKTAAPFSEIMTALFPCASVTGAPKPSTMGIIADLETAPRGVYTGAIGFLAPKRRAQFNVAIRTVVVDRETQTAEYGVGGGIVWDSEAEDEYQECCNKSLVLTEQRPEFSLLESLLWEPEGKYLLLEEHLDRFCRTAAYFDYEVDRTHVRDKLLALATDLAAAPHKVRLLVAADGNIHTEAAPLTTSPGPVRLRLAATPVDSKNVFLYHKTTHRQVYEQAKEACPDCDDVVLFNERSEVTETTIANIVVERDGQRLTPPVTCGLLGGVFRNWLVEQGEAVEAVIRVEELERCDKIFVVNSVRRWREAQLCQ